MLLPKRVVNIFLPIDLYYEIILNSTGGNIKGAVAPAAEIAPD